MSCWYCNDLGLKGELIMRYTEQYFQYKMMGYEIIAVVILAAIVIAIAVKLFQKIANWFYNKQQKRSDRHD